MLAVGLWGLHRGGMWRDEAVTYQVARRTVPQIWRLLHGVDAVHGLYYLLMHVVLAVAPGRPGEVDLRLPSVCAAAVTASLVAALGARLARPRVGLWAGLLFAVTPLVGHYAQEGRSYALVAAGATGATLVFVRAAAEGGRRTWALYGGVLAVTCWLHEFAVLLLLAHAGTLALARSSGRVWRGWCCAAGGVVLSLLPMVVVSGTQSAQVAWLTEPDVETAQELLRQYLGPTDGVYWACLALGLLGLTRLVGRRGEVTLAAVALPLAVLPPVALMLASQFTPLYVDRYVLYALAGAPLLVALGADRLAGMLGRLWSHGTGTAPRSPAFTLAGVLAVVLAFTHQVPLLRADRVPGTRPDDLGAVARAVARVLRPGDPVLFLPAHARGTELTYPEDFRGTRDVALAEPGPASGTLYGREVGVATLRRRLAGADEVWAVVEKYAMVRGYRPRLPTERAKYAVLNQQFVLRQEMVVDRIALRLYVRPIRGGDGQP
ncbi:glycosyltransferase family 39 protein [Streptomyces arenae]|uniref:glycosyltransferase family 39 protein n=1 Tax=Streptomyces arenae TaxID=29301 RepID=UPI002657E990|nr:glycosyltransferase family 39 protein [Streptomyces arenae]MCG7207113.1 glycosyltransferase family 39 protein [Streptomyces arenae]